MHKELLPALQEWAVDELLDNMTMAEVALQMLAHLLPKARFASGKALHVQFDGGVYDGVGTGGFVILDGNRQEVIRAGRYYGPGQTNNKAESFAMRDVVHCLQALVDSRPDLHLPVRIFGDS